MKKASITLIIISLLSLSLTTNTSEADNILNKYKISKELSSIKKKAAIIHMMKSGDCSWNGISLYGKVQIVDAFPDIKVEIVDAFPDIKVKWVDAFPDDCGEWQEVEAFPDFKIQIVDAFPDLKVQEVDAFPGMN